MQLCSWALAFPACAGRIPFLGSFYVSVEIPYNAIGFLRHRMPQLLSFTNFKMSVSTKSHSVLHFTLVLY